ncbi:MAG: TerB family tellurite resistance protein [Deltaproteobacteria bacterium]|jgi:tellurite resistance protein|nr:TerB family tellurite resistance protein [Deltaproteobacteria bacterium]MBW2530228.1 TerB family tellurite resistance protein [Deltaproteobacteria bacterium]
MDSLTQSTLARLRDRLQERGQRPSIVLPGTKLPESTLELLHVTAEYGALCEAMYLMMAADGRVLTVEREVLKGALRELSDDTVRGVHIEAMIDAASKRLVTDGREARMQAVVESLQQDPVRAEVAIVLAAAIAFADGDFAPEENDILQQLAQGLGLSPERVNELLGELDVDLKRVGKTSPRP